MYVSNGPEKNENNWINLNLRTVVSLYIDTLLFYTVI